MSPLHDFARRIRHSRAVGRAVTAYRRAKFAVLARTSRDPFPIDLYGAMGFGATLSNVVNVLSYCDRHGLHPFIKCSNRLYGPDPETDDWFAHYFEHRLPFPPGTAPRVFAAIQKESDYPHYDHLPIEEAHRLFEKYVVVKPAVREEADVFAQAHFHGPTMGVHYRGTDKHNEAPVVAWDEAKATVEQALAAFPHVETLFVTSDDQGFIDHMRAQELSAPVRTYDFQETSQGGQAIHLGGGDGYRKGYEALLTMLLLAKCDVVVRTASHLSAWGKILNPAQKVVMLNQPFEACMYFPDSVIWKERVEL